MNNLIKMATLAVLSSALIVLLITATINTAPFDEELNPSATDFLVKKSTSKSNTNAYYAVFGFEAPANADMIETGQMLVRTINSNYHKDLKGTLSEQDFARVYQQEKLDLNWLMTLNHCAARTKVNCSREYIESHSQIATPDKNYDIALNRYLKIISMPQFKNAIEQPTVYSPLPRYSPLIRISRVYLLNTFNNKGLDAYIEALNNDLIFWRKLLNGDSLITQMVATAAIWNAVQLTHELTKNQPINPQQRENLVTTFAPLTAEELNINDSLTMEMSVSLRVILEFETSLDDTWLSLGHLAFQPNATQNQFIDTFTTLNELMSLSSEKLYSKGNRRLSDNDLFILNPSNLYNPLGKALSDQHWFYFDYSARVHDLNGMISLLRLSLSESLSSKSLNQINLDLSQSKYKNPYTQAPFTYNKKDSTAGFDCLSKGNVCHLKF